MKWYHISPILLIVSLGSVEGAWLNLNQITGIGLGSKFINGFQGFKDAARFQIKAALDSLYISFLPIYDAVNALIQAIARFLRWCIEKVKDAWRSLKDWFTGTVQPKLTEIHEKTSQKVSVAKNLAMERSREMYRASIEKAQTLNEYRKEAVAYLQKRAAEEWPKVQRRLDTLRRTLADKAHQWPQEAKEKAEYALKRSREIYQATIDEAQKKISAARQSTTQVMNEIDGAVKAAKFKTKNMIQSVKDAWNAAKETASEYWEAVFGEDDDEDEDGHWYD